MNENTQRNLYYLKIFRKTVEPALIFIQQGGETDLKGSGRQIDYQSYLLNSFAQQLIF